MSYKPAKDWDNEVEFNNRGVRKKVIVPNGLIAELLAVYRTQMGSDFGDMTVISIAKSQPVEPMEFPSNKPVPDYIRYGYESYEEFMREIAMRT